MKKIKINASTSYEVIIGRELLKDSGKLIKEVIEPCRAVIIGDDNTLPLYGGLLEESLKKEGFDTLTFSFPHGEKSKTTSTLVELLEFMAINNITRKDMIAALGGGVTGDISGLAAATYLRGISYVQLPTTILAAVDSSVGGKTAVNLKAGKNLMGAFYQPRLVICDCDTFKTLPEEVYTEGLAEAIKYGVIVDNELFNKFKEDALEGDLNNIEPIIERCVYLKGQVVSEDEFDKGQRQLLNFGHTIGHAIEKCSSFKIPHGFAVAMGMAAVTRASENSGICEKGSSRLLEEVLQKYKLPINLPYSSTELSEAALSDKKRLGDNITLVVPERIGRCILHKISVDHLTNFIELGREPR
ncbi:3-dehydroquinate synthase [Alloiococcus sp. CFN-8]|uniref:3-dehydroquinate synthase n=1 Tax=Alloiococcus sp. CFN-8 TaxID=3416081 RepID=UPI003CFB9B2C